MEVGLGLVDQAAQWATRPCILSDPAIPGARPVFGKPFGQALHRVRCKFFDFGLDLFDVSLLSKISPMPNRLKRFSCNADASRTGHGFGQESRTADP